MDELEGARRETRRASFGRERRAESETRADEATFRPEHAPAGPRPAVAVPPEPDSAPAAQAARPEMASGASAETARASAGQGPTNPGAPAAGTASIAGVIPNGPRALLERPAFPGAQAFSGAPAFSGTHVGEAPPAELAQILRAGATKSARSAAATPRASEAAMLERATEILRQIRLHSTPDVKRLTLELEPAELGRLSIQLALRAGKLTAIVRAESAATLEALEQRENELQNVLAERGITADSMRFELGFGQHSRGHTRARAAAETPRERASVAPAPPHTFATTLPPAAARLDTYA